MKTNCSALLLIFSLSLLFSSTGNGQSITEHFSGKKVTFELTTVENVVLNDQYQYLVSRATKESAKDEFFEKGFGFGFGFQSIHLEFATTEEIKSDYDAYTKKYNYRITFYDQNNNEIAKKELSSNLVKMISNTDYPKRFFYSIDLKDIPLLVLDSSAKIDISKVKHN